jgi:putative transcriptional regulator
MDRNNIAKRLVKLRGNKTQAEVAEKLGISQSTYAMYETGKRTPSDEVKIRIANLYNRTVQFIFFNQDVTKSEK